MYVISKYGTSCPHIIIPGVAVQAVMGYTMAMEANAMENQKLFEEFPYKRPDLDQLKEE